MEIAQVGVRTRARAALAMGTTAPAASTSPKRRKIIIENNNTTQDLKFSASSFVQIKSVTSSCDSPAPEECSSGDESPASCCSSKGSFELDEKRIIKFSDLEVDSAQVETSTCNCSDQISKEMSLSSELRTNSQEVDSVEKCVVLSTPQKMPTESELEEFFAAAEKNIQKHFSDKYNYDIVKDVPLEGHYDWVQLKP